MKVQSMEHGARNAGSDSSDVPRSEFRDPHSPLPAFRDPSSAIRILGIDPGTATVGWGVVEQTDGQLKSIAHGHISTSPKDEPATRLREIHKDIEALIKKYHPDESAIEKLFFFKNQKTIIEVAQARGVILLTLSQKIPTIGEYTPLQVKQALTGYGRAEKNQVQQMVKSVLGLSEIPKPDDVADALALAICHIHSRKILQKGV